MAPLLLSIETNLLGERTGWKGSLCQQFQTFSRIEFPFISSYHKYRYHPGLNAHGQLVNAHGQVIASNGQVLLFISSYLDCGLKQGPRKKAIAYYPFEFQSPPRLGVSKWKWKWIYFFYNDLPHISELLPIGSILNYR